jgi:hypothetical protein
MVRPLLGNVNTSVSALGDFERGEGAQFLLRSGGKISALTSMIGSVAGAS